MAAQKENRRIAGRFALRTAIYAAAGSLSRPIKTDILRERYLAFASNLPHHRIVPKAHFVMPQGA